MRGTYIRYGVAVVLLRADRLGLLVLERPVVFTQLLPVLQRKTAINKS